MLAPVLAVPLAFFAGRGLVTSLAEANTVTATGVLEAPAASPSPSKDGSVFTATASTAPSTSSAQSLKPTPSQSVSLIRDAAGVTCDGTASEQNQAAASALRERIATAIKGNTKRVSFVVHDWGGGLTCSYRSEETYLTASIVKVATVAAVMRKAEQAGRSLTSTERSLAREAIEISDNNAQSSLWTRAGGVSGMSSFFKAAGMAGTKADDQWGLTVTTAADQAVLLDAITHGDLLSSEHRDDLLKLMRSVDSSQNWGISNAAPDGEDVALKNGWYPDGAWRVHSIGYVGSQGTDCDYVLTVLTESDSTQQSGIDLIEATAKVVHLALESGREG